jgi:hypothetical protein
VYEIPEAIYDLNTQFNLIGIPFLSAYFNDTNCSTGDDVDADGTTIKLSGYHSRDHGRHVQDFTHGESTLPKLVGTRGMDIILLSVRKCSSNIMIPLHSHSLLLSPFCRIAQMIQHWFQMMRMTALFLAIWWKTTPWNVYTSDHG